MPRRKIRYLLLTRGGSYFPQLLKEGVLQPGLYNWRRVFDEGRVARLDQIALSDLENYDIIHVNLCGADVGLVSEVKDRLRGSSTCVICNLDYAVEFLDPQHIPNLPKLFKDLMVADLVFAVEPYQQDLLRYVLKYAGKRDKPYVPLIPHPVDTKGLKKLGDVVEVDDKVDVVLCYWHRYNNNVYQLSMLTQEMPVLTCLVGVKPEGMPVNAKFFDLAMFYSQWKKYSYFAIHAMYGLDYITYHTHGRVSSEAACWRIGFVGTKFNYTASELYPDTTFYPWEMDKMRESLMKMVKDDEFWEKVTSYAYQEVEKFGYGVAKARLIGALQAVGRW